MGLESATYATQLVTTNPQSSDPRSQGDDHLRMLKTVVNNEMNDVNAQWTYTGDEVTRQAVDRFSVAGDETARYARNRRVKVQGAGTGTVYGYVTSSTYSASTSVNLKLDSGTMDNETLTVWVGDLTEEGWARGANTFGAGSFTPTFTFETPGDLSVSYSVQEGNWRRSGDIIYVQMHITCTPTYTSASGAMRLGTLPFQMDASITQACLLACQLSGGASTNWPAGYSNVFGYIAPGVDYFQMFFDGDGQNSLGLNASHLTSGVPVTLRVTGTYIVE